ncbi:MAG: hypothetical protein IMZ75_11970 [Actinobacteria bacterium]|nr:hypothetical protein [Actinomycetota bacterium]
MAQDNRDRANPRRPAFFTPLSMDRRGGPASLDPARVTEVAHETAAVIVKTGRAAHDPELTCKLVALVDDLGLSTIAELWADRPARSLPGALWRLYVLREWVCRDAVDASADYAAGIRFADVPHVVAGVAEPTGPAELRELTDAILTGVFDGDLAVALERASGFCRVVAAGRAQRANDSDADESDAQDPLWGFAQTRRAASLLTTADDLEACARLWRKGDLL